MELLSSYFKLFLNGVIHVPYGTVLLRMSMNILLGSVCLILYHRVLCCVVVGIEIGKPMLAMHNTRIGDVMVNRIAMKSHFNLCSVFFYLILLMFFYITKLYTTV